MAKSLGAWLLSLFSHRSRLAARMERLDEHNREVRHDLKNVQAHTDYLRSLVLGMRREDDEREPRRRG
jgi:hypothetical protein